MPKSTSCELFDRDFNREEVAELLGITPRRVNQLTNENVIPLRKRGCYDLRTAVAGYTKFLKERNDAAEAKAKTRMHEAKADLAEMDAATRKGELVEVDEVKKEWGNILKIIQSHVLNIGPKIAPLVEGMDDARKISHIIVNECREFLTDLSDELKTNSE